MLIKQIEPLINRRLPRQNGHMPKHAAEFYVTNAVGPDCAEGSMWMRTPGKGPWKSLGIARDLHGKVPGMGSRKVIQTGLINQ